MYTEEDLHALIDQKLTDCTGLPSVCSLLQTPTGTLRVKQRIIVKLFNEGVQDIDAALGQIESEISFSD